MVPEKYSCTDPEKRKLFAVENQRVYFSFASMQEGPLKSKCITIPMHL